MIVWLLIAVIVAAMAGVYFYRELKEFKNAQPAFIQIMLLGLLLMLFAVFAMGIDEDRELYFFDADSACMAQVWFYVVGFAIAVGALVVKTVRIKLIFNGAKVLRRKVVSVSDMIPLLVALVAVEIIIMILWQSISPMKYERIIDSTDASTGQTTESHGVCTSDYALPFLLCILGFKTLVCSVGNFLAFDINKPNNTIGESRLLSVTLLSTMQSFIVAVPLCYLLKDVSLYLYAVQLMAVLFAVLVIGLMMVASKFYNIKYTKRIGESGETRDSDVSASAVSNGSSSAVSNGSSCAVSNGSALAVSSNGPLQAATCKPAPGAIDGDGSGSGSFSTTHTATASSLASMSAMISSLASVSATRYLKDNGKDVVVTEV